MMTLDLALITHNHDGMQRIIEQALPAVKGVRYVISWQAHNGKPIPDEISSRPDILVCRCELPGLSNNRNNSLDHCTADIILLADNDVAYTAEGLNSVIQTFRDNPNVDVATFRSAHGDMSRFPDRPTPLKPKLPKGYYVTSFELALRRSTAGNLRCCPELGLGAPIYQGGEDEMLLMSAIRRGLRCEYFPITICAHPHDSTGTKARLTTGNMKAMGCIIALTSPLTAIFRLPLKAYRLWRKGQAGLVSGLYHITTGALAAPAILHRNHTTLW